MDALDSYTINRDGRIYTVEVHADLGTDSPRMDDHDATQFYVTANGADYVNDLDDEAGDALAHFIAAYGYHDADRIHRAFDKWAVIADSPVVLVSGSDNGYSQSDWHAWFALVDTAVMARDGYQIDATDLAESEAEEYAAWAFGDVFGIVVTVGTVEVGDCWGIVERHGPGSYGREVAEDIVDGYESGLAHHANLVGAGFVGTI